MRHASRHQHHPPQLRIPPPLTSSPLSPDALPPFPPAGIVLHRDDANSKVLVAIARILLAVNNCAMTIKDLAEMCLLLGLLCHNVSAATQAITSFLRVHLKRCKEQGDDPLVLKHTLSGTPADNLLAPALYSLTGGAPVTPLAAKNILSNSLRTGPCETQFRKGTIVWYLSAAAGAQCPFLRAGLPVPVQLDEVAAPPVSARPPRKRKRQEPAGQDPGPPPQRPKLVLRLKPLPRPLLPPVPSDPDDSDDDNMLTPYSAFPQSAVSQIEIPRYLPDLYHADEFDYASPPPDSEDEDADFHKAMMGPPAFDFGITHNSSPESSSSVVSTPDVKQEPSSAIVKSEADDLLIAAQLHRWEAGTGLGNFDEDASVIRITPATTHQWASIPHVIDLVSEPWRFPSVSSVSEISEDVDMDDICVKEEELVAKIEPVEESLLPLTPDQFEDDVWQPGAIPDNILDEVTRRLSESATFLACPPVEPVTEQDFNSPCYADTNPPRLSAHRRATVCSVSSCVPRPLLRPGRSSSMSCVQISLPTRVVLPTSRPFAPAIIATFIHDVPVYQTFLDAHRLLRRSDSDFVNITPLMRFLRVRFDFKTEGDIVVVKNNGRDGVSGLWAPLSIAQRLARSHTPDVKVPGLPPDILNVFLREGLESEFPAPFDEVRESDPVDHFGGPFGNDDDIARPSEILEWPTTLHDILILPEIELVKSVPPSSAKPTDLLEPSTVAPAASASSTSAKKPLQPRQQGTRSSLRRHSQLAKEAIASIAEDEDQEEEDADEDEAEEGDSSSEGSQQEDEESDLTEPEPDPVPPPSPTRKRAVANKENAVSPKPQTRSSKGKAPSPPPPASSNLRSRKPVVVEEVEKAGPRRSTRHSNAGAVALAVGVARKRAGKSGSSS